jgi:hypothetical protein
MTPKPKLETKQPVKKATPDDEYWDNWVEEEGRKLTDEEFQERLKKVRMGDPRSKTLEEVAAELGIDLNEIDDED